MKITKKINRVAHRTLIRAIHPFFPYKEPEIYENIERLGGILRSLGSQSVLIVTDKTMFASEACRQIREIVRSLGIRGAVYDGVCSSPTLENVEDARAFYLANSCDTLIAFGGGSSIDCAKAVGARIAYPERTLAELGGKLKVQRELPGFIAIPTTAGTGSEAALTAYISDRKNCSKITLRGFSMVPKYAILDPTVTYTMPPALTASTGMDALTRAVEVFVGGGANGRTRTFALMSAKLIFANIDRAYKDSRDTEAREAMLRAAYLAGTAFSRCPSGYASAMAHALGGRYDISHSEANAALLPHLLEAYGNKATSRLAELSRALGVAGKGQADCFAARALVCELRAMLKRFGIPEHLECLRKKDVCILVKMAKRTADNLHALPRLVSESELDAIYKSVSLL